MTIRDLMSVAALAVAACAGAPAPAAVPAPLAVAPAPAPAPLPPPTEAAIIAQSHDVLTAFYRNDAAALAAVLAPGFVKFEEEHVADRAAVLANAARGPTHPPETAQVWKDQHVYLRANDALFIGMAVEHETANSVHGNREYDGWYTMSWVRDGGGWKVAHWAWQPHRESIERARDMWNGTYRQSIGFNHKPNQLLVDTVRGVAPGAALDVMMGQGRNAVYLASQGWRVTGIDIADEGLRTAREAAAAQHLELAAVQTDAETYDFGAARWDLVTLIYAGHSAAMIEKIKRGLKPGGRFVVEYFLAEGDDHGGFAAGELAKLFAGGFDILRDDVVEDTPDWAKDRAKLVRFVARKR